MMFKKIPLMLVGFALQVFFIGNSWACPAEIQNLKSVFLKGTTFCEIYEKFQKYKSKGELRQADYVAPRFINLPDWIKNREIKNYDPVQVYTPAPLSWLSWERGQIFLNEPVTWNQDQHQIAEISLDWIIKMHTEMMQHLSPFTGKFRDIEEYGLVIKKNVALSRTQTDIINSNALKIYKWQPTLCLEEQTPEEQKKLKQKLNHPNSFEIKDWPAIAKDQYFKNEKGEDKQCGIILYPNFIQITPAMTQWVLNFNNKINNLSGTDLLFFLSQTQKDFVGIHPFADGNGRVSRNVVEYVLLSLDLPPPIFENMDEDLYSTEAQWAQKIGEGMKRSLEILKKCQDQPEVPGCKNVPLHSSLQPSPIIDWIRNLGFK